ncbi:MAG: hypothetical protein ACLFM0_08595 [Spirochaetales bacterium]
MSYARVAATALYAPGEAISNDELMRIAEIEFDAQKYREKIGIESRHIARLRGIDETTADFAEAAAKKAIENAELNPADIDLFIVATDTPEYISPPDGGCAPGPASGWSAGRR